MNALKFTTVLACSASLLVGSALASQPADDSPSPPRLNELRERNVALRGELDRLQGEMSIARERAARFASRGRIGVTLGQVHEALASHLGLDAESVILIESVFPGAAADKAGVKAYDILIQVDGQSPVTQQSLREAVAAKEPGESIKLAVLRAGERQEIEVAIEAAESRPGPHSAARGTLRLEGADPERLSQMLNEMLEGRGVDEDTRRMMRQRIREYSDAPSAHIYRFESPQQTLQWREMELLREGDEIVQMWVRPSAPIPSSAPGANFYFRENLEAQRDRMQRIEERLERIEKMLEQLLESRS